MSDSSFIPPYLEFEQDQIVLILTSSGGSGHLIAGQAIAKDIEEKKLCKKLYSRDFLLDWLGFFGIYMARFWNFGQKKGSSLFFRFCDWGIGKTNFFFWIPAFYKALKTITSLKINVIIDVQPLGSSAIMCAIWVAKTLYNQHVSYQKILTELPTTLAIDFFKPIQTIPQILKKNFRLVCTHPLIPPGSCEKKFWKECCRLELYSVFYRPLPLRKSFLIESNQLPSFLELDLRDPTITLYWIKQSSRSYSLYNEKLRYHFLQGEKTILILLGAVCPEIVFLYIKKLILGAMQKKELSLSIFAICSNQNHQKIHLLLADYCKKLSLPKSFALFLLPYQQEAALAHLMKHADVVITKSGGITSMELFHTAKGSIWIHKEDSPATPYNKYSTMPAWELGNALYLKEKKGASFVSQKSITQKIESYFNTFLHDQKPCLNL